MPEAEVDTAQRYLEELERLVQSLYDGALAPLADPYAFELPEKGPLQGMPTVLFLGNHSSGKSSFINHLLGSEVQKTGLAPVDDGFTILLYGDSDEDFDGQTVVSHPKLPYKSLERYGPGLVSRLSMKARPHELLKTLTLIDSPGMIDAPDAGVGRGYDFSAAVRHFADLSDLVLFFFDPDKPGTTGETMSVFTQALAGLDHKILILLNKVDRFSNMRDFARAYGALCWNLSKIIRRKDLPLIYNTYIPQARRTDTDEGAHIPLADFDVARNELIDQIDRAPAKRADNLVSNLHEKARHLEMHVRVCGEVAWELAVARWRSRGLTTLVAFLAALISWVLWSHGGQDAAIGVLIVGALLAGLAHAIGRWLTSRLERALVAGIDAVFERIYRRELSLSEREDLRGVWSGVRDRTLKAIHTLSPTKIPHLFRRSKPLKRLQKAIAVEIPRLRRDFSAPTGHAQER